MAIPLRRLLLPAGLLVAGAALLHRARHQAVPDAAGVRIADTTLYDHVTGWLLGGFYAGVADDIARTAPEGGRVLDIGCGPGQVVARLADRGLEVTGADLDPAMIERARRRTGGRATLDVADVARLPYPDGAFDVVVSTLSMHHWSDPAAGLAEVARVLRPDGRLIVWDLAGARVPLHGHVHGPAHELEASALAVESDLAWRWPGPITLVRRVEARKASSPA